MGPRCWELSRGIVELLLYDDNRIKITRKPRKKQKENPVGCTGKGKRRKENIGGGYREGKK